MSIYTFVVVACCALFNITILLRIKQLIKVWSRRSTELSAVSAKENYWKKSSLPEHHRVLYSSHLSRWNGKFHRLSGNIHIKLFQLLLSIAPGDSILMLVCLKALNFVTDFNCLSAPYLIVIFNAGVRRRVLGLFRCVAREEQVGPSSTNSNRAWRLESPNQEREGNEQIWICHVSYYWKGTTDNSKSLGNKLFSSMTESDLIIEF